MSTPPISIIVNVRNGEPFLQEAIDSALAQSFTDWEMIVWDDCSDDRSAEIVAACTDPRVRYMRSPEATSLATARNNAIGVARGKWLAFLDQDDIWMPDKLERQIQLLDGPLGDQAGLLYGRTVLFAQETGEQRDFDHRHEFSALPQGRILEALFRDSCFIAMSSAVIRRDALEPWLPIPSYIAVIPDYYMYIAVARQFEALAVETPVCRYRVHAGNMSHFTRRLEHQEALLLLDWIAGDLPEELVRQRRRVHSTILAYDSLAAGQPAEALRTMLKHGSFTYALSRPLAIAARNIRRRIATPSWMRQA